MKNQVPDIKSSLVMIKKLRERKEENATLDTQFLLSEQVVPAFIAILQLALDSHFFVPCLTLFL